MRINVQDQHLLDNFRQLNQIEDFIVPSLFHLAGGKKFRPGEEANEGIKFQLVDDNDNNVGSAIKFGDVITGRYPGAPAPGGVPVSPPAGGPMPLAAIDEAKYERTNILAQRAQGLGVADYRAMPEYNAEDYLAEAEFKQAQKAKELPEAFSIGKFARGGDEIAID